MTEFSICASDGMIKLFTDLCSVKGTHLTIAVISHKLYIAAISPEFFKILNMNTTINTDDLAVRIQKSMIKPLLSDECILSFSIGANICIRRCIADTLMSTVTVPLEYDFNSKLIEDVVASGMKHTELYDIGSIIRLRPVLGYSDMGIQCRNDLAYTRGPSFIVYCKMKSKCDFLMTTSNISELIKFIRAYGDVQIYECGTNVIFQKGASYFGCRQPVSFVDTEYSSFTELTPICETTADLVELHRILRAFTVPKGQEANCAFNLEKGMASINLGDFYRFGIAIKNTGGISEKFSVPVDVLKKLFSNIYIDYGKVVVKLYESLVVFEFGDIQLLISRSDIWDD